MPLQKYSLTPAPNAWDALLDYGADARQLYAHLVLGRLSERTGLIHCRRKGIEREIGLRGSQLDAALVDVQKAGVAAVSDLGDGSIVIALVHYLEIVPTRPNNRRGWILDAQQIPDCDAKAEWFHRLPGDPQLPEYTGGRGSLVKHKSNTSGSPKQKRTEQNRREQNRSEGNRPKRTRFSPPTVDEVAAHMRTYAEGKGYALDADRCAEDFYGYWSDQGWRRRGGPMRSWQGTAQRKVRDAIDKGEYRIGGPVKGQQKPRHVQQHEGAWFDKQGGYWRTQTGYPIDQWGKPDYGAKVRFNPEQQEALKW